MSSRDDSAPTPRQEEFLQLLLPLRHRLMHFARAMERNPEAAEDLVSDTILAALERFDSLNDPTAFLSFLFTIAARLHRRRRWRGRLFGAYDPKNAERLRDGGASPEMAADVRALYEALNQLPRQQREAVALFEISGLSIEEIRQLQGGTLSAVKMRLKRGRERLAELLGVSDTEQHKGTSLDRRSEILGRSIQPSLIHSEINTNG